MDIFIRFLQGYYLLSFPGRFPYSLWLMQPLLLFDKRKKKTIFFIPQGEKLSATRRIKTSVFTFPHSPMTTQSQQEIFNRLNERTHKTASMDWKSKQFAYFFLSVHLFFSGILLWKQVKITLRWLLAFQPKKWSPSWKVAMSSGCTKVNAKVIQSA